MVQGIIDLFFIDSENNVVLLDFKTDFVENGKEQVLVEKYYEQLKLYKKALEESIGRNVDKVYIYSVWLGKAIEV